jgi:hypothetical protein
LLTEVRHDACYYKVRSRYRIWPSAYASGALVQCRKKGAKNWGNTVKKEHAQPKLKSEAKLDPEVQALAEDLHQWFRQHWVRFGPDGVIRGDCARASSREGKPKCLPKKSAENLGKKGRASAAQRKRRQDPDKNRRGLAHNVQTKK